MPPFWLANEIEIGFLSIILLWLNSVCFSYSVGLASSQTQHLSGSCVLPDPASYRIRHLFGSCILPDPASYKTRHLSGSCILPDPASYKTRHLSGSYVLPDPASYKTRHLSGSCILPAPASHRTRHLSGSCILPDPASHRTRHLSGSCVLLDPMPCNILMLLLPEPGTNKRVKSSKRYPLRPRSTSFALIGPYHEPKKSLPLQREDYQFGIQVLGWKVVARGNSFLSRGDGFYLRRANSKMYFCPTNCGLSDEKLKPEVRVGYAPKSHKP